MRQRGERPQHRPGVVDHELGNTRPHGPLDTHCCGTTGDRIWDESMAVVVLTLNGDEENSGTGLPGIVGHVHDLGITGGPMQLT
jgi:hypothetical protein